MGLIGGLWAQRHEPAADVFLGGMIGLLVGTVTSVIGVVLCYGMWWAFQ